ncbi:MAG: hypothetical protein ACFB6R_06265 [Alphaproteobacteria bacterium]
MPFSPPPHAPSEEAPSLEQDLAFLRAVAEQGRRTAVVSGAYLVLWGVLIAGAYFANYMIAARYWPVDYGWIGAGYGVMGAAGWAGSMALGRRERLRSGVRTVVTRIYSTVFISAGLALTIFSLGAAASPAVPLYVTMIVGALIMGLCFLVTGLLGRMRWLTGLGALWFVVGAGLFAVAGTRTMLLCGAVAWLALLVGPGVVLMAQNRRAQNRGAQNQAAAVAFSTARRP